MERRINPFPDIARFPSYSIQLPNSQEYLIPAETIPAGMPIPETSVFRDPNIAISAQAIGSFLNSPHRRTAEQISVLCKDVSVRPVLRATAESLYHEVVEKDEDNIDRVEQYEQLLDEIALNSPTTEYLLSTHNRNMEFPPSTEHIPQEAVDLANKALMRAYPQDFGTIIPILQADDVRIVSYESMKQFMQQGEVGAERTYVVRRKEALRRAMKELGYGDSNGEYVLPDCLTLPQFAGKPILMADMNLSIIRDLPEGLRNATLAFTLIHENLHRAVRGRNIAIRNSLVYLGFDKEQALWNPQTADQKAAFNQYLADIEEYLNSHEPFIEIEGAIIHIRALDDTGFLPIVASAGYDLNEAIIEFLAHKPRQALAKIFKDQRRFVEANILQQMANDKDLTTGSQSNTNYMPTVAKYLSSLGLASPREILRAYTACQIPRLHAKRLEDEPYLL